MKTVADYEAELQAMIDAVRDHRRRADELYQALKDVSEAHHEYGYRAQMERAQFMQANAPELWDRHTTAYTEEVQDCIVSFLKLAKSLKGCVSGIADQYKEIQEMFN